MTQDHPTDSNETDVPQAPWLQATLGDIEKTDFERPLAGQSAGDCHDLASLFQKAAQNASSGPNESETAEIRVFQMLAAITSMYFKPEDRSEPFGPTITYADGRRSAIPSDFRQHIEGIWHMAQRAKHPALRARLADLCWLLDRKKGKAALAAVCAYTDTMSKLSNNELLSLGGQQGIDHDDLGTLRRALWIGRSVGWDKPEVLAVRELAARLWENVIEKDDVSLISWLSSLILDFQLLDPGKVGQDLEFVIAKISTQENYVDVHLRVEVLRHAGRAFHLAKMGDDKNRCLLKAAEELVRLSDTRRSSAMVAAHFLADAISSLHGLPNMKERRTQLRHKLIDLQASIPDEMSTFSEEIDLKEIVETVRDKVGQAGLLDKLFIISRFARSPDVEKLIEDAKAAIRKHPLSFVFDTSHVDREGKTIFRSQGDGLSERMDSAIRQQIDRSESIRRKVDVVANIEAARNVISEQHYLSEEILAAILRLSPFVPQELIFTYAIGFTRFFQGDFTSATYVLTPLLEGSLRYVLKTYGHDVSIFDDDTQTQQDRTISSLFEQMRSELEAIFSRAIVADIERVFLSKPGPSLRHTLAHGLMSDGDPRSADAIYGCCLIFKLCMAPLIPHKQELLALLGGEM